MGNAGLDIELPGQVVEPVRTALPEAMRAWGELLGERLVSAVLFGSVARGDARPDSDVDLLLVVDDLPWSLAERRLPIIESWQARRSAGGLPAIAWSLVVKSRQEARAHSPLYLDMVEDAVLLYDHGGFFGSILDTMRRRMHELGSRRVYLPDGSWYWDLKPDYRFGEVVEI